MSDVIQLDDHRSPKGSEPGPDAVWRCGCGCTSYFARADGQLECVSCGSVADGVNGEWRAKLPDASAQPLAPMETGGSTIVKALGSSGAACRRILAADPEELVAAITFDKNGTIGAWGLGFNCREKLEWLDEKLAVARKLLTETGKPT